MRLLRSCGHTLKLCVVAARLSFSSSSSRDYVAGGRSSSFYKPQEVRIAALGIVNEDTVYFQTRLGVSALHDGFLTPVIEVGQDAAEITAFHLCHHRGSFFYEVLAREGGVLSVFEYSLASKHTQKVAEFQDESKATALACVDQLLLRASQARLLAVHLLNSAINVLLKYTDSEHSNTITSLSVGYAADIVSRAQIFAVVPHNHTLLRLHLTATGGALLVHTELFLQGGDGSDGMLSTASALNPSLVLWAQGKVVFVDGCSVREAHAGHVRTLLGSPDPCHEPANETVEPVPWASRLSRPLDLAGSAEGTSGRTVLLLTQQQVVQLEQHEDPCAEHSSNAGCAAQHGCAWAAGSEADLHSCFDCSGLEQWAHRQRPAVDACSLEEAPRAGTRYSLTGCGCMAPPPTPPAPSPPGGSSDAQTAAQVVLTGFVLVVAAIVALLLYRGYRRAAVMRELYGVDNAEFHIFADDESFH